MEQNLENSKAKLLQIRKILKERRKQKTQEPKTIPVEKPVTIVPSFFDDHITNNSSELCDGGIDKRP